MSTLSNFFSFGNRLMVTLGIITKSSFIALYLQFGCRVPIEQMRAQE